MDKQTKKETWAEPQVTEFDIRERTQLIAATGADAQTGLGQEDS